MSGNHEYLAKRKDGTEIPVSVTFSLLHDIKGNLDGFVAVSRDISGSKSEEYKLKHRKMILEKTVSLAMGREQQMIELKKEVNELLNELGREKKYIW